MGGTGRIARRELAALQRHCLAPAASTPPSQRPRGVRMADEAGPVLRAALTKQELRDDNVRLCYEVDKLLAALRKISEHRAAMIPASGEIGWRQALIDCKNIADAAL